MRIPFDEAVKLLLKGEVVAIPTETVYGLAALYNSEVGVSEIFALKNRPPENPLILHVDSFDSILQFADVLPPHFKELADRFWPGPLTLVIPIIEDKIPSAIRANLPTQAFRVPSLPLTRELIVKTGPLVAPSANLSGSPSSTSFEHVEEDFGEEFPVLEGGSLEHGVESTILIYQEKKWWIGRLGAIPGEAFAEILGYLPQVQVKEGKPLCPGQHFRHYAPKARLHLTKSIPEGSVILGFMDRSYPKGSMVIPLGVSKNPAGVLRRLYQALRRLDREEIAEAYVDIDVPVDGLWATFHERVKKAARE